MVNLNGLTTAIVSIMTFLQNLGASANSPELNLPAGLRSAIQGLMGALNAILLFIPSIPAFDIRWQLVLMAIGIPMLLDVMFIWLVSPVIDTIFHLLDLAIIVLSTMLVTRAIAIGEWSTGAYIVTGTTVVYIGTRLLTPIARRRGQKRTTVEELTGHICNHFMAGLLRDCVATKVFEDIERDVSMFSRSVVLIVRKPKPLYVVSMVAAIAALVIVSLWSLDVFRIVVQMPSMVSIWFPYVGFALAFLFTVQLIMRLTACGRRAIQKFTQFVKRWGLRLLMLFLELLYIPILTNLVTIGSPVNFSCGAGSYLYYDRVPLSIAPDPLFPYVNHTATCRICDNDLVNKVNACVAACSGENEWRLLEQTSLLWWSDVLVVSGGVMLYAGMAFGIGIPLFWAFIIHRNKKFVRLVPVYGKGPYEKWRAICRRMETTGTFLFAYYRYDRSYWSIFIFFVRLVVMVINTVAGRSWPTIIVLLPIWYTVVVAVTTCLSPYLFKTNNWLDVLLYSLNGAFSVVPVFATFKYYMNESFLMPVLAVMLIIPIVSLAVMLCCKHKIYAEDDPTVPEEIMRSQQKVKKKKKKPEIIEKKELDPEEGMRLAENMALGMNMTTRRTDQYIREYRDGLKNPDEPGESVLIKSGYMDSIKRIEDIKRNRWNMPIPFTAPKNVLQSQVAAMYDMIDRVIDGSTIELLTNSMNIMMIFGSIALGWYLGALTGVQETAEAFYCG